MYKRQLQTETQTLERYISDCIKNDFENTVEKISFQGGSLNPKNFFLYANNKIEYLCYINEYFKPCVMQQPMLKQHIEKEIKNNIQARANECFDNLVESYEKKGYAVELKKGSMSVELLPKKIAVTFNNYSITLTKSSTEKHDKFQIILNNNLYELVEIANSIVDWEITVGDMDPLIIMEQYHYVDVDQKKQSEGSKIYLLKDKKNRGFFQFSIRNYVFMAG